MSEVLAITPGAFDIPQNLEEARVLFGQMIETEVAMRSNYAALFAANWRLGEKLCALKESVGLGKWELWREANLPDLEENKARRCMAFYRANETAQQSNLTAPDAFTPDSIRALLGGYIPAKLRPTLEGDQKLSPPAHHFSFVSAVTKWDRQLAIQIIPEPEVETMRAEVAPAIHILAKRLGADWLRTILASEE